MAVGPATADQLEAVRAAQDEFRVYWESIRPLFPCAFEGSGIDVYALDYLDYEGLPYPSCGQAGAALVWGNVIATQMPFRWFFDEDLGGLVLRSKEKGLTIWPFGRVYESQRSAETRFDKYRRLLDWVILQSLGLQLVGDDYRPRMLALVGGDESGFAQFVEHALARLRELRGGPA